MPRSALLALCLALVPPAAGAAPADVVAAAALPEAGGTFRFDVTVRSQETGWDKYADRWEVLAPDGTLLGARDLAHPHVDEQPFTRSLGGVAVPAGIAAVRIRARDSVEGWGGAELEVALPGR